MAEHAMEHADLGGVLASHKWHVLGGATIVAASASGFCAWRSMAAAADEPLLADADEQAQPRRIFWHGRHTVWHWSGVLGKIHPAGLAALRARGWREVPPSELGTPLFSCTTRNAADFGLDASGPGVPRVRQLPQSVTNLLDDKVELHRLLNSTGVAESCMPSSFLSDISDAELDALVSLNPEWSGCRWFVKYRTGVQGKSVHPCRDLAAVKAWLAKQRQSNKKNPNKLLRGDAQFVVQRAVPPFLLANGRRFVLRVHALLLRAHPGPRAWLHADVICLPYSVIAATSEGCEESEEKCAHVSQVGKRHPPPYLLARQEPDLYHTIVMPQLHTIMRNILTAAGTRPVFCAGPDGDSDADTVQPVLYSLLGLDLAISPPDAGNRSGDGCSAASDDQQGRRLQLLEINTYPAIGSGTMSAVATDVYTRLVLDMASVLGVLGHDGQGNCARSTSNGFVEVAVE